MLISKGVSLSRLLKLTGFHMAWLLLFAAIVALLYRYQIISIEIPWLPVSVIATAVAFYLGFKNSQAYDRMWEARKIWGGIVNFSRTWGMYVDGFVGHLKRNEIDESNLKAIKKKLVYRHIAWLYKHRIQLLAPQPWEHVGQTGIAYKYAEFLRQNFGLGQLPEEITNIGIDQFLDAEEFARYKDVKNVATQLINEQSRDLRKLREKELIDDFRHMEMTKCLSVFYELQGKNERIKKFPLPRQYAIMSRYFVGIFVCLLPFTLIPELMKLDMVGFWLSIPITALVGWVYIIMEIVGDYTENPFQGFANDIPMLSLCRTIEIDLREMLGETDLPEAIEAKNNILM